MQCVWFIELEKPHTNFRFSQRQTQVRLGLEAVAKRYEKRCDTSGKNLSAMAVQYRNTHYHSHEGHMPPIAAVLVLVGAVVLVLVGAVVWPGVFVYFSMGCDMW